MRNKLVEQLLKETSLDIRLKIANEMAFIHLITLLGYRENKSWDENDKEDNDILIKIIKFAKEHTDNQLKTIEEWKKDTKELEDGKS